MILRRCATALSCLLLVPAGVGVAHAHPTLPGPIAAYDGSDLQSSQWHLAAVNAPAAWAASSGAGTLVAVIDSGLEYSAEFDGRVSGALTWRDGALQPTAPESMRDEVGHGTHVAGLIAAARDGRGVTGVAPLARLMPIDVSSLLAEAESNEEFVGGLVAALDAAAAAKADVVNMSLGASVVEVSRVPALAPLCAAIARATAGGTLVVVAAGNSGDALNPLSVPAACPGALSVAAVGPDLDETSWSSADETVALAAPGVEMLSTWPRNGRSGSPLGLAVTSGTSMAAPVVAGAAALLASAHPDWPADRIREALVSTARDVGRTGRDPFTGAGVLDVAAAVGAGSPAPTAQPVLAFSVVSDVNLSDMGFSECGPCAYVSWHPYGPAPTGYTLVRTDPSGAQTSQELPGTALRQVAVGAAAGSWLQLTAHLPGGGQVASIPTLVAGSRGDVEVSGVTASWERPGVLRVKWDLESSVELASVQVDILDGFTLVKSKQAPDPGARSMLVRVPSSLTGLTLTPAVAATTTAGAKFGSLGRPVLPDYPVRLSLDEVGRDSLAVVGAVNTDGSGKSADWHVGATAVIRLADGTTVRAPILNSGMFSAILERPRARTLVVRLSFEPGEKRLPRSLRGAREFALDVPPRSR